MNQQNTPYLNMGPYQEIVSGINLILSIGNGVVKLTGPDQAGKSSLLRQLHGELKTEGIETVMFFVPPKSAQELHDTITRQLTLGADLGFRKALTRHLMAKPKDQQHLIILFDDVEQMSEETLLATALLRSISNNEQPMVSLVLCGTDELNTRLADPAYDSLVQDITLSYELNPLSVEQLPAFAEAASDEMQLRLPSLTPDAIATLHASTGGFPAAVIDELQVLSKQAMLKGTATTPPPAAARPGADAEAALERFTKLGEPRVQPWRRHARPLALAVGLAVVGVVGYPYLAPMLQRYGVPVPGAQAPVAQQPAPTPAPTPEPAPVEPPAQEVTQVAEPPQDTTAAPEIAAAEPAPEPVAEPAVEAVPPPAPAVAIAEPEPVAPAEPPSAPPATSPTQPPASAAAPAVATSVPLPPRASAANPTDAELAELIDGWLAAWQNKDLGAYFTFYHTDFAPLYQPTRASWRNNRAGNISRPASISIQREDLNVASSDSLGVRVQFWMNYNASGYADRTLKELFIGRDLDGRLRILQEYNRQVQSLVPGSQVAAAPPAAPRSAPAVATVSPGASRATQVTTPIQLLGRVDNSNATPSAPPQVPADEVAGINGFVTSWLTAWQNQDTSAYFRHYTSDFAPPGKTRAAWEDERVQRITRPLAIQMSMRDLQVTDYAPTRSALNFSLEYHSTYYADRTLKQLILQRSREGGWLISNERNLAVEQLPLSRLLRELALLGDLALLDAAASK